MDAHAIQVIQEKLRRQAALHRAEFDVPVDWPAAQSVRIHAAPSDRPGQRAEYSTTVETLKQRSGQGSIAHTWDGNTGYIPPAQYQRRLQSVVNRINHLAREQEQAIAEIRQIHLEWVGTEPTWHAEAASGIPAVYAHQLALPQAAWDGQGNLILGQKPLPLVQPEQEARELAVKLRRRYSKTSGSRGRFMRGLFQELRALAHEPQGWLIYLWNWSNRWLGLGPAAQPETKLQKPPVASPSLSRLDALLWGTAGVIARLALNYLLQAIPSLWTLVVIGITAATAYALYRALLAPQPNLAVASRLLLVLGGLFVGGRIWG